MFKQMGRHTVCVCACKLRCIIPLLKPSRRFMSPHSNEMSGNSRQSAPISIARVRQLFSRTERVAESQFLRREISGRMFERLALIKANPLLIVDAGCGEGEDLLPLHQLFPHASLLGIDASSAMLSKARSVVASAKSAMSRIFNAVFGRSRPAPGSAMLGCADFARLPLAASSVDLIWSNLALHWHPQPDLIFAEWRRVMRVDGLLMFSCFGPDSFRQLREAFVSVGENHAVLPFVDLHDFGDMLVDAGFSTPVMDMEILNITYSSTEKLLRDLRAIGGNPLITRRRSLWGRKQWEQLLGALERHRGPDGLINLSVEVIYGHAFRPVQTKTANGESIIKLDLKRK